MIYQKLSFCYQKLLEISRILEIFDYKIIFLVAHAIYYDFSYIHLFFRYEGKFKL